MESDIESSSVPAVSIIIPVYNVEKYLARCLESVFAQTYRDFEVILVDDGSTDSSGKMCDAFVQKDRRVQAFHKENGGLSDARNYGVTKSVGRFIVFVDSDDYISDDYVEYSMQLIKSYDADVAITKYVYDIGDNCQFHSNIGKERCLTAEEALVAMMYKVDFTATACAKIYKRELIVRHPYPVGVVFEDLATTYKIIADCKKVVFGDRQNYCYRQREGSIVHQNIDEKNFYAIKAAKEELEYMEQHFPNAINAARFSVAYIIIVLMDSVIYGSRNDFRTFHYLRNELKPFFISVLFDNKVSIRRKIRCIVVMAGYYPTLILWKLIAIIQRLS